MWRGSGDGSPEKWLLEGSGSAADRTCSAMPFHRASLSAHAGVGVSAGKQDVIQKAALGSLWGQGWTNQAVNRRRGAESGRGAGLC